MKGYCWDCKRNIKAGVRCPACAVAWRTKCRESQLASYERRRLRGDFEPQADEIERVIACVRAEDAKRVPARVGGYAVRRTPEGQLEVCSIRANEDCRVAVRESLHDSEQAAEQAARAIAMGCGNA